MGDPARIAPERLGAAVAGAGQPTAEGHLGDIEGLGDVALDPAPLLQVQGTVSPPFETLGRDEVGCFHPSILLEKT